MICNLGADQSMSTERKAKPIAESIYLSPVFPAPSSIDCDFCRRGDPLEETGDIFCSVCSRMIQTIGGITTPNRFAQDKAISETEGQGALPNQTHDDTGELPDVLMDEYGGANKPTKLLAITKILVENETGLKR